MADLPPTSAPAVAAPAETASSLFVRPTLESANWARPLLYFFFRYPAMSALALTAALMSAMVEMAGLGMLLPLLAALMGTTANVETGRVAAAFNAVVDRIPIQDRAVAACSLLLAATVLRFALAALAEYVAARVGGRLLHDTKMELLEKYYRLPHSFFLEHRHADLKQVLFSSTQRVSSCFWLLSIAIADLLHVAAVLTLLLLVSVEMALVVFAAALIFYAVIGRVARKLSYRWGTLSANSQVVQVGVLDELLQGLKHILVLGALRHWLDRFRAASLDLVRYQTRQRLIGVLPKGILEVSLVAIVVGVVVVVRASRSGDFVASVPVLGVVGFAFVKLLPSLNNVSRTRLDVMHYLPELELLHRALTYPVQAPVRPTATFAGFTREIEFENVCFAYPGREPTFDNLTFAIRRRQTVAIVGRSGIGKTTIANLLLGLYEPQSGVIRVDGVDLRDYDVESWRRCVGIVSQDVFMFHGTVAENIAFGDHSYTREQIESAARLANADEFVRQFPSGYDTVVGEHGTKLSGGQRQRLVIARVLLRRPEIMIFDEATSALDAVSERLVQDAIARAAEDRTVIVIAHRLTTVQRADTIVVLENGRAVEQGSHATLMQARGAYERLILGG